MLVRLAEVVARTRVPPQTVREGMVEVHCSHAAVEPRMRLSNRRTGKRVAIDLSCNCLHRWNTRVLQLIAMVEPSLNEEVSASALAGMTWLAATTSGLR
jgi:hypothetical protein